MTKVFSLPVLVHVRGDSEEDAYAALYTRMAEAGLLFSAPNKPVATGNIDMGMRLLSVNVWDNPIDMLDSVDRQWAVLRRAASGWVDEEQ